MVGLDSTVLVVDDDPDVLEAVTTLLQAHLGPYARVVGACDGARALAIGRATRPDLIVCDYTMPTMDGPAFVRRARSEPTLRHVPILMLSAEPALGTLASGLDVQALVSKSDVERMADAVQRLLGWTGSAEPRRSAATDDDCSYCGTRSKEAVVERNGVLADEWFPENTPSSVKRPAVPACRACADKVRAVQFRLWLTWGLSAALDNEQAVGITERLWSALSGELTAPRYVRATEAAVAWVVDPLDAEMMMRRLARALYRWETKERLPIDAPIRSAQLITEHPSDLLAVIAAQGLERRELGPGIVYWFARESDSDYGSIWYVAIWSRIFLFAKTLCR